jgi:hypothetical protein
MDDRFLRQKAVSRCGGYVVSETTLLLLIYMSWQSARPGSLLIMAMRTSDHSAQQGALFPSLQGLVEEVVVMQLSKAALK